MIDVDRPPNLDGVRVAHYVRRYPVPELGYITDQIVADRGDVVIAERGDRSWPLAARRQLHGRGALSTTAALADRARDRLRWGPEAAATGRFVAHELEEKPAAVLHAHFGMAGAQVADALNGGLPALVTTFYGVDASACLNDGKWQERFRSLWTAGDAFVVLSEQVVPRLVAAGADEERIHVWNIGIDFAPYAFRERRLQDRPLRILCAARFVEKKGHEVLLPAFAQLTDKLPATLTLVGYGPLLPAITAKIGELGIGDHVTVIDTSGRDDFTQLFASLLDQHDVFALPSTVARNGDDEGGPALTVVCAQAAGLPVIVTPFAGAERSVGDGVTGLICDYDPSSLSERLLELVADPDRFASLGKAGAERVRAEFALEAQLSSLERIYGHAIETKVRRTT